MKKLFIFLVSFCVLFTCICSVYSVRVKAIESDLTYDGNALILTSSQISAFSLPSGSDFYLCSPNSPYCWRFKNEGGILTSINYYLPNKSVFQTQTYDYGFNLKDYNPSVYLFNLTGNGVMCNLKLNSTKEVGKYNITTCGFVDGTDKFIICYSLPGWKNGAVDTTGMNEYSDVPLRVVSCEYVHEDPQTKSERLARGSQYDSLGAWKVSIKNYTNYNLPAYISADYQGFSGTDVKVNDAEHIQSALYNFHNSLSSTFNCKAYSTTDFYIRCKGMPYPEGDMYYLNVWNGFGILSDGQFQGGSTGGSHGGTGGTFGKDTGDVREIQDYGYKCIYTDSITIPEDEKWETNPLGDDNTDDFGFDDNGPLGNGDLMLSEKITEKFPFSLPFDIYRGFKMLIVPPKVPEFKIKFEVPLMEGLGVKSLPFEFTVNFNAFEKIAILTRWGSTIAFVLVLIKITPKYVKGVQ